MNLKSLRPLNQLAKRGGVKAVIYGQPGTGKTPLMGTCPNPVALITEPGLLSARRIENVDAFEADTAKKIYEFFNWFFKSNERKKYNTLCVDSLSQLAEIILKEEESNNKHGLKAYGEMARKVFDLCHSLYYINDINLYLVCKLDRIDQGGNLLARPYFPGKDLNVKIPHLFDEIFYLCKTSIPGVVGEVTAVRTHETFGITARDRSGNLNEFEQPNFSEIFRKCLL